MPLAKPTKKESKKEFIARCMSDEKTKKEFPNNKQRLAVCNTQWDEKKEKSTASVKIGDEEIIFS